MSAGGWAMAAVVVFSAGVLVFLVVTLVRSIQVHRSGRAGLWREFGPGLVLMLLFFTTWGAQAVAQWQTFTDEARAHGEAPGLGDFVAEFTQSTMENWQSEFLQLFSFVTLAALYVHKGSAESKDSDDEVQAALRRIEVRLGTVPAPASGADLERGRDEPPTPS